jgi:hypothetical protein
MPYTYILSVAKAGCNTEYDTIVVNNIISVPHTPKIETDSAVCTGDTLKLWLETVSLLVTTGYIYGPNLLPSISYVTTRDYIYIPNVSLADTGWYYAYAAQDDTSTCYTDTSKLYIGTNIIVPRPATAPIATITATPGTNVGPWVAVTFRANTLSAGSKPKYQWRKNGINIPGATDSIYTATTNVGIMTGDTITVLVERGPVCIEDSVSAPIVVNVNLGVEHIGSKTMSIYPNPNNGSFTIRRNYPLGEQQNIIISNLLGEVVYTTNHMITQAAQQITLPSSIAQGHYILKLTTTSSSETTPIIIQR